MFGSTENRDALRKIMTEEVLSFKPDAIFFPSPKELMQDHQAVAEEIIRIIRTSCLLAYEVPKHSRFFNPNVFVQVSRQDLDAKLSALNIFTEQASKFYFSPEVINAMATLRAATAGISGFMEGFELYHYRNVIDVSTDVPEPSPQIQRKGTQKPRLKAAEA